MSLGWASHVTLSPFNALKPFVERQEWHQACKKFGVGLLVVTIWLQLSTSIYFPDVTTASIISCLHFNGHFFSGKPGLAAVSRYHNVSVPDVVGAKMMKSCSNKIQNGGILVPACPGRAGTWAVKHCCFVVCQGILCFAVIWLKKVLWILQHQVYAVLFYFALHLLNVHQTHFLVYCMYANITTVLYPRECAFARQNASASKRPFYTVLYS